MRANRGNLQRFQDWIVGRGRSEGTAGLYARNVRLCHEDPRGLKARLTTSSLSPAARRLNLASLRAWCRFAGNDKLAGELEDLKMPRLERVVEKKALTTKEWNALLDALEELDEDENVLAVMQMICWRGFRVGDVCRLSRAEVREGLESEVLIYCAKAGRHIQWSVKPFRDALEQLLANRGWNRVRDLISPGGSPENRQRASRIRIERAFQELAALAGLDPDTVYPHRLRRTYAKHYLKEVKGDPVKLQKHMGWASIQTAIAYVDEEERKVLDRDADRMMRRLRS
jgi:integrase